MDTEYEYPQARSRNPMATAAIVLGIISLMSFLFFYSSVPCGALAVLCALLSRGQSPMPGRSKAGLACGICGLSMSLILTVFSVWTMLTNTQMRSYLEYYMQYYLGDSSFDLDRELESAFPFLGSLFENERSAAPENENTEDQKDRVELNIADDEEDTSPKDTPETSAVPPSGPSSDEEGRFL